MTALPLPQFIHLRLHTEYSLVDGLVKIKSLLKHTKQLKMPAIAVTDESNVFAWIKLQQAAFNTGIKPIFGCDLWVQSPDKESKPKRLCLLIKNKAGFLNLSQLLSNAYQTGDHHPIPIIQWSELTQRQDGLIALSGGREGEIGQLLLTQNMQRAQQRLDEWMQLFPNHFYLEVQRTDREDEERYIQAVIQLAAEAQCPVVATNDVRFIATEDFEAHEVRVCINQGETLTNTKRSRHYSPQQYLRSTTEMAELFADLPSALANTIAIAQRCSFEMPLGTPFLPNYPIPSGYTIEEFFKQEAEQGLAKRLQQNATETITEASYQQRLAWEIDTILQMGYPGYFLIVMDFIRWAKQHDIPVGPGRGSGAGSLVAYALEITDLDPLQYDLLFERFLNPERVSMPDFDVDFCMEGRDRVIEYVTNTYGRDAVSQIITFGTMAAKAVVRDVGRVQGKPYGFVDRIAKLIPFELGITLHKAIAEEPQLQALYEQDEEVRELLDMAKQLEGTVRNVGKHAGGVVIAPTQLTQFTPLYSDPSSNSLVTQFDKDDVEQVGLVKFDFLGLRTLTIIDWALQFIHSLQQEQAKIAIDQIPLDDSATFKLLQAATTTAVFQLESRGMKDLIQRLQPDHFEDIVALVALFRPGPLQSGMVDDYINRKHGRAPVEYAHPSLEPILKNTHGVILYQEQVMQIAQVLAGYSLGQADLLRRAMGKKKPEEMAKHRQLFLDGAQKQQISADQANFIFDLMEKFAGYGFNKSHSAAYALISYQTAWLKTHHPAAFMAAVLSADLQNTDKIVALIEECQQMRIKLLPPHVNHSDYNFTVTQNHEIRFGLGAIKGVGEGPVQSICDNREQGGPFKDLFDFCHRIDLHKANRRCLEALIRAGALDQLGPNRTVIFNSLERALQAAEQAQQQQASGMADLFADQPDLPTITFVTTPQWSTGERLQAEKETLGFYLTGHPIEEFQSELSQLGINSIKTILSKSNVNGPYKKANATTTRIAGFIIAMRILKNKRGDKMAFITLDDHTARIEVSVFAEAYQNHAALLVKDQLIIIEGQLSLDHYSGNLKTIARNLLDLNQLRQQQAAEIVVSLNHTQCTQELSQQLKTIINPYQQGQCKLLIAYQNQQASALIEFGNKWQVQPAQQLIQQLKKTFGENSVAIQYPS